MPICKTNCAVTIPPSAATNCQPKIRRGGIDHFIFASCDIQFTDINDPAEWQTYIDADKIRFTGKLVAQKNKGSASKKRLFSSIPEITTGFDRPFPFKDANYDELNPTASYDFWNYIDANILSLQFGYLKPDGLFYGFHEDFSLEVDEVVEETNKDASFFEGQVMVDERFMFPGQPLPFLKGLVQ